MLFSRLILTRFSQRDSLLYSLMGYRVVPLMRLFRSHRILWCFLGFSRVSLLRGGNAFLNMLRLMQKKALQLAVEAEKGEKSGLKMDGRVENVNFGSNSDLGVEETPVVVSNSGLKVDSRYGNVNVELDSEVGGERSPVQSSNSGGFGE
nr:hypothetical protein CFP56_38290 [Quercus suber]